MDDNTQEKQESSHYTRIFTSQDDLLSDFPPLPPVAKGTLGGIFPLKNPRTTEPAKSVEEASTSNVDKDGFTIPKNKKNKRKASPPEAEIQLRNKYQMLTDSENAGSTSNITDFEENTDTDFENLTSAKVPPQKPTDSKASNQKVRNVKTTIRTPKNKNKAPPPIIIEGHHGKNNHALLKNQLDNVLSKGYTLKYSKNNTSIYAVDIEQYGQYKATLQQNENIKWHTYATEAEKTHAFVAKGLDNEPDPEVILHQLINEYKIEARKVHIMKTKYRPLYLIITSAKETLKHMKQIKYLNNVEVKWELRRKFTDIMQCKSCYSWGHSASYCKRTPRCPSCGETHEQDISEQPCQRELKCANCNGPHKATDLSCAVYKFRLEKLNEVREKTNSKLQTYTAASKPTENIWETRRKNLRQQQLRKNPNNEYSSSDEDSENEAAAFSQRRTCKPRQQSRTQTTRETSQPPLGDNVSELLSLSKEFKALGNSLTEALRFLRDFLQVFKTTSKEGRAFALLNRMIELEKYDF